MTHVVFSDPGWWPADIEVNDDGNRLVIWTTLSAAEYSTHVTLTEARAAIDRGRELIAVLPHRSPGTVRAWRGRSTASTAHSTAPSSAQRGDRFRPPPSRA